MASPNDDPLHDDSRHGDQGPTRRTKSADAFRTISEVSEEVGVPQHVLRFWETKFSQIKPLKRGGGRRYYRPEDIDLLNRIRAWLYDDGYTIKGVQKLLREGGATAAPAASRATAAAERAQADGGSPAPAGPAAPEMGRQPAQPSVLRRPAPASSDIAGEDAAGAGSAAAAVDGARRPANSDIADPDRGMPEGVTADRIPVERAILESLIEGLEEVRDRLRGPPPEP
ncbi:MAG: MerR family transcriptional regulator [Rhodospirillaceae bacterium]|nr:MerR family transcriptional regulator [Rhodospirillaceae bacterium]